MTNSEYAEWREESIPGYAAGKVASGQWSEEESLALSRKENAELLPLGLETPENHFYASSATTRGRERCTRGSAFKQRTSACSSRLRGALTDLDKGSR